VSPKILGDVQADRLRPLHRLLVGDAAGNLRRTVRPVGIDREAADVRLFPQLGGKREGDFLVGAAPRIPS
jgi:hypothetical protein